MESDSSFYARIRSVRLASMTEEEQNTLEPQIEQFKQTFDRIEQEVRSVIVGMQDVVRLTLTTILAGGHVLLEGVPGLGKTLLVKTISSALGLSFRRIQFTPDLMPSDVTGTQVLTETPEGGRAFVFKQGPVFANIVLADEINRATPKTQSSLLEAMEEKQVTVLGETYKLALPFFVLATQNPVELEGTYPLPEAQLDRFMVKLLLKPPTPSELKEVLSKTTGSQAFDAHSVFEDSNGAENILEMRKLVRQVYVADKLQDVIVRIISALTPGNQFATKLVTKYIRFGPGPRGAQSLMLSAKASSLLDGRVNLSFEDIRNSLIPTLRHRMIMNFQAEADGVSADDILEEIRKAK